MRTRLHALCFSCAALAVACGGGHDATAKELADMRAEIMKLRADGAALAERLDAIEIARGAYRGGSGQEPQTGARPGPGEDRPSLGVVRLGPAGQDSVSEDPDAETARPVVRSSGGSVVVDEPAPGAAKGSPASQKEYDQALELFRAKSYDKALEAFAGFMVKYPDHPYVDNATYWRGQCLLGKGEQRLAVEQLEAVVTRFPKGNKAPDALYDLVKTYAALGETQRAEQAKKKLLSSYPQSDAARKLRSKATPSPKP